MNKLIFNTLEKYKFNSVIFLQFIKFLVIFLFISVTLVLYVYQNTANVLQNELETVNKNNNKRFADMAEMIFRETEYISSRLASDNTVRLFALTSKSEDIFEDMNSTIRDKIMSYTEIYRYIDSIYIYSGISDRLITSTNETGFTDDDEWLDSYKVNAKKDFCVVPRRMSGRYPFVLSFINQFSSYGEIGLVVINIDVQEVGKIFNNIDDVLQNCFILSEDGTILFAKNQKSMFTDYKNEPILENIHVNKNNNYLHSEIKSEYYDWTYITTIFSLRYKESLNKLRFQLIITFIILTIIGIMFSIFMSMVSFSPFRSIIEVIDKPDNFDDKKIRIKDNEVEYVASNILRLIRTNEKLERSLETQISRLNNVQLAALQMQINPHFLYNTLNIISLQAHGGNDGKITSRMIIELAKLLRFSIENKDMLVDIRTEIKYANIYVNLLKLRYEDTFMVKWEIDENILDNKILKICLQPFIENCVYHGFLKNEGDNIINISGGIAEDTIFFTVEDNGVGIDSDQLKKLNQQLRETSDLTEKCIGVFNINMRIKLLFGDGFGVTIKSKKGYGTRIEIKLPIL